MRGIYSAGNWFTSWFCLLLNWTMGSSGHCDRPLLSLQAIQVRCQERNLAHSPVFTALQGQTSNEGISEIRHLVRKETCKVYKID